MVDNCGITKEIRSKLAQRISEFGVSKKNLIVSATHTHNAPSLRGYAPILWAGRTSPEQEKRIDKYTSLLIDKMESIVIEALKNDLNVPKAITELHRLATSINTAKSQEMKIWNRGNVP